MPIIVPASEDPLAVLQGFSAVTAGGSVESSFRVRLISISHLIADGSTDLLGAAILSGSSSLEAFGRIGAEPNRFGEVVIEGGSELTAAPGLILDVPLRIHGNSALILTPRIQLADSTVLTILLTIADPPAVGFGQTLSARISAAGVGYPIKAFNYAEDANSVGETLECTFQKNGDRDAILAASNFKFEIYENGSWKEIFDAGIRTGIGFSLAWASTAPNDVLQVNTTGPATDRMQQTPLVDTVIYDSLRETINVADFKILQDTDGNLYVPDLTPIPGMQINDLLHAVFVTACGFSTVHSTLPNWPIRRADFQMTTSFYDGVKPHIGAFNPLIFVKENAVWILDPTVSIPAGFADPVALNSDQYELGQFQDDDLNADGFRVSFSQTELDFDYFTDEEIIDPTDTSGTFGSPSYTETDRKRTFRKFYKNSQPLIPVNTTKISETETLRGMVDGSLLQLHESVETIQLDSFGFTSEILRNETGLIPDLSADGFPVTYVSTRTERSTFDYKADIKTPLRKILSFQRKKVSGLVTTDSTNKHLDKPFVQEFKNGFRSGNLSAGLSLSFVPISEETEIFQQNEKGEIESRSKTTDFLTSPPTVNNATGEVRGGDGSLNGQTSAANQLIVLRAGSPRTNAQLQTLSVGELPMVYAKALAQRLLNRRRLRRGTIQLKGINLNFERGSVFECFDRDGFSVGRYIVEGRAIAGSDLGTAAQVTKQVLQVIQVI